MANTYTLISSNTVGSGGVSSVTFSSIPSTYSDLLLKASVRGASAASLAIAYNGSTANFTNTWLESDGSAASSGSNAGSGRFVGVSSTATSVFTNLEIYIPDYLSSKYKTYSSDSAGESNTSTAYSDLISGRWSDSAAITSIGISGTTMSEYSSFYLYGIKNT